MTSTSNRWLVVALGISISINLLVAGMAVGYRLAGPPPGMLINPMFGLRQFAETLPEDRRTELVNELRSFRAVGRPQFREMRNLQEKLRAEIRRDPLDPVALKAALAALHEHMQAHQAASHDAFVQLMQVLTPAERVALDQMQSGPGPGLRGPGGPPFMGPQTE